MTPNESPLDREILDENAELGIEGLRELIDMYLSQAKEIMQGLQTAIHTGAARDVRDLAHKLAGSSVVCGVNAVVTPLRALEQQGRDADLSNSDQTYTQAKEGLELAERLLAEYLAEKK
jgi:HPt (histidine-containing phosphotransfer) domain-containing protein